LLCEINDIKKAHLKNDEPLSLFILSPSWDNFDLLRVTDRLSGKVLPAPPTRSSGAALQAEVITILRNDNVISHIRLWQRSHKVGQ
jgi:hypothetical protein